MDGSSTWNQANDVKEAYPVHLEEYAVQNRISEQPYFAWWIKYVLKKRDQIVSKTASKYWHKTHKYGVRIPKLVNMGTPSGGTQFSKRWAMLDHLSRSTRGLRLTYQLDTKKLNAT